MHLAPLIHDLAVILAVAGLVTLIFQRIRQPVVLGYLVAGMIVGPYTPPFPMITDLPNIRILAELGVIFLMFTLGLEFSFRKLARVGGSAGFTSLFEVLFMLTVGYLSGTALGWSKMDSVFLGAMLSISSTTIIIKALDELGLKSRRFAELIFGILIVEDLVAILMLVALTTLAKQGMFSIGALASSAGRLALVVGAWFLAGYFVVPRFVRYVGRFRSNEMLAVVSLGLCLSLVAIAAKLDYSAALGAFIMGSILAESSESQRIEELMEPLRDVFAAIFFVSVGMLINPVSIWKLKTEIAWVALLTIAGKMTSTTLGALFTGQNLKSSIQVGFGLAQIGEFSFIIAGLGLSLGVMSERLYPIVVAVSLLTTFTTPYMIKIAPRAAHLVEKLLPSSVRSAIDRYSRWRQRKVGLQAHDPELKTHLTKWVLNGFVVTLLGVGLSTHGTRFLESRVRSHDFAVSLAWAVFIVSSAPFVWAMFNAFRKAKVRGSVAPAVFQILSLSWLVVLSFSSFKAQYIGMITAVLGVLVFSFSYRQLEALYRWFEDGFLEGFKARSRNKRPDEVYHELAPWDAHLVKLKVHPDAKISGQCLADAQLRRQYGLNVVAIQRGSMAIVAPKPDQVIFPKDELLVLGTDEQIDQVRKSIEDPVVRSVSASALEGYELRRVHVGDESDLLGRSIRDVRIREDYDALVVGIERRGRRIMNPESDMVIEIHDNLLVVGSCERLERLIQDAG